MKDLGSATDALSLLSHTITLERKPNFAFEPVGRCIYCRAGEQSESLTKEHILPDGLNGHLILPKASCKKCQIHIHKFETEVITYSLNLGRAKFGVRSKKGLKKDPLRTLATGDGLSKLRIEPSMPSLVAVSHYNRRADLLTGHFGNDLAATSIGWTEIGNATPGVRATPGNFTRFAAKVAHAYAVAALGLEGFRPFLTPHILGSGDCGIPAYLGVIHQTETKAGVLHKINVEVKTLPTYLLPGLPPVIRRLVIVSFQLFVLSYNLPLYEIVAGEMME